MKFYYGWVIVALSFLMLVVANGVALTFGVFLLPISLDLGLERTTISLVVAVFMFAQGVLAPLVGLNIDRFGPRRVVITGLALLSLAAASMSQVNALWQLHLVFGLLLALGYSCVTLLTNAVIISRWFQKRRGLALGISITGLPVGPLLFSRPSAVLIENIGWQNTYLVMAALIIFVVLPLMFWLLKDRPEVYPEGEFSTPGTPAQHRWSLREALPVPAFQKLAAAYFACGFTMSMVQTHFPAHAHHAGMTEVTAATAFGSMGVLAILGTVLAGAHSDRYGRKTLLAAVFATRMLALLLMAWAPSPLLLIVAAILFGLSWTATGPLVSILTGETFGLASMGLLFGTIYFAHQVGACTGAYAGGFLYDLTGAYQLPLGIAAVILGIASLISYRIKEGHLTPPSAAAKVKVG